MRKYVQNGTAAHRRGRGGRREKDVAGCRPQKSRRDDIIIEKSRKMSFNPEGVNYRVGHEIMSPLRGWIIVTQCRCYNNGIPSGL